MQATTCTAVIEALQEFVLRSGARSNRTASTPGTVRSWHALTRFSDLVIDLASDTKYARLVLKIVARAMLAENLCGRKGAAAAATT
ncbi:hypothetical protein V1227_08670 [Lentzea sp. DG1S-22]|uniref:hypothetical protein n=1 Tax=Lentzea sp. DG1S-22 TaxID=3108822 RepID=UPI002E77C4E9|nr:hypothetical protein [Lentzea sp. DG1S-22]WVH82806.1 hypothetical protein V1227_08670 [Lentzea sp. DG1S-22]